VRASATLIGRTLTMHKVKFANVDSEVAKKVLSVNRKLDRLGLHVGQAQVSFKTIKDAFDVARNAWLVYSMGKEIKSKWPKIREVLESAGLSDTEIISLDLSKKLKKKRKKK
jgi:hypothetical protein